VRITRGGGWAFALKGALADHFVVLTAFLVVLLATSLVAAIPIYSDAVAQSSLRERLDRAPSNETDVLLTVPVPGGTADSQLDERVRGVVRDAFASSPVTFVGSSESEPFTVDGRVVAFASVDGFARRADLVSGRWPRSAGAIAQIVVPAGAARTAGLEVGDVVRARSRLDRRKVVTVRVVGSYRLRPSRYWSGTPLAGGSGQEALVMTRSAFLALGFENGELHWRVEPDFHGLTVGQARALRHALTVMPERLNAGRPPGQQFTIETTLPDILETGEESLRLARAGVLVPSIQLGLLAAYGLLATALLLTDRRLVRTEGLRLRGASTTQLGMLAFLEASMIALPAVVVAPFVASAVLYALNEIGPLATTGMHLDPHVSASAYALAAAAGAVCVAGLVVPVFWTRPTAVAGERRPRSLAGVAQRFRLDLVVAALAALGYWQLRRYHGVLVANQGGLGIDPLLVAAPALLLLAGALLSLRLVPLAAQLVERFLPSARGAVAALGFWQLARRPRGYTRSVLLLVLAVAIGVFAATYNWTWHRSQLDQASYAAGADILVQPSEASGAPPSITRGSTYRALGAEEALPVTTDSFDLARFGGESGTLLALDARRAGGIVHVRDDFASRSAGDLLRPLAAGRGSLASLALPGKPRRVAVSVRVSNEPSRAQAVAPSPTFAPRGRPSSLYLYLRDGDGVVYSYRLGELRPARASRFVLDLSHVMQDGRTVLPRYPLALVGLELDLGVPYLVADRVEFVLRSLEVTPRARGGWQRVSLGTDKRWRASASTFDLPYERARVETVASDGGVVRAALRTGSVYGDANGPPPTTEILLRPGRDSLPETPLALASDAFLAATSARPGDVVPLALSGGTQPVRIVGTYHWFPTLDPALPSVIVDLPTYLASSFTRRKLVVVVQPSSWWLETERGRQLAEELRAPPYQSLDVVSRSERERALVEDPASLSVIGALTLGLVIAAVFAVVGFGAAAATSARARMLEFAVLRSVGLRTGQLSSWIALESALVVVLSLVAGTLLGLLVAWLVLPYVGLGASGATPAPPVRVVVPWPTVVALLAAVLVLLVAIAAAQVAYVRRIRLAPVLRGGEGSVAP
jgi:hypothetical protein